MDLLLQHCTAPAAEHAGEASEEDGNALSRALRDTSHRSHPRIAALGGALLSGAPEDRLSRALRTLITGIERTAVPQ